MATGKETIALAAATGVTLLIGGVERARAATLVDSQTFSIGPASVPVSASSSLTFNKFDPLLGTLTGVLLELDNISGATQTFASIALPASELTSPGTTGVTSQFEVQVGLLGSGTIIGPLFAFATATCTPDEAGLPCASEGSDFQGFGGTFVVSGGAVAGFVGASDTFDVDLVYSAGFEGNICPTEGCEHTGRIVWDGEFKVEYTYTPTTTPPTGVPEPASLALFGVGLAGLAALRRRKLD